MIRKAWVISVAIASFCAVLIGCVKRPSANKSSPAVGLTSAPGSVAKQPQAKRPEEQLLEDLEAKVVVTRKETGDVALNVGTKNCVSRYQVFAIFQNDKRVARVRIENTFETFSGAKIIESTKDIKADDIAKWDRTFVQPKYHNQGGWDRVKQVSELNKALYLDKVQGATYRADKLKELKAQGVKVDKILADEEKNRPRARIR